MAYTITLDRNTPHLYPTGLPISVLALDMLENILESKRRGIPTMLDKRGYRSFYDTRNSVRHI